MLHQGITTYEYVVAMRAMSEAPAGASVDEELPNVLYSPSGSATTGMSGGSSLGLQYRGAWCTPPRVFVDYQVLFLYQVLYLLFNFLYLERISGTTSLPFCFFL